MPCLSRPWALLPDSLERLARTAATQLDHDRIEAALGRRNGRSGNGPEVMGRVAVIPIHGMVMPDDGTLMSLLFGGADPSVIGAHVSHATADPDVDAILLDVNSPGGVVDLLTETAAVIRHARQAKPVVAVANTMACSGAYWLAAQATEMWASPSADVGSIGVYRLHESYARAAADEGYDLTLVRAGEHKADAHPAIALSDTARAHLQEHVDDSYDLFVADVAAGRGVDEQQVRGGMGEGRVLTAHRALAAGLVNHVGTATDAVRRAADLAAGQRTAPADPPPSPDAAAPAPSPSSASPRGGDLTASQRRRIAAALAG